MSVGQAARRRRKLSQRVDSVAGMDVSWMCVPGATCRLPPQPKHVPTTAATATKRHAFEQLLIGL
jgi:hypothetical protein